MVYKFLNKDINEFNGNSIEFSNKNDSLLISMNYDSSVGNEEYSTEILIKEEDLENLILALTNIQRDFNKYKKSN